VGSGDKFDQQVDRLFASFDKDGDGFLTRDEAPVTLRQQFDTIDTSQDGVLDVFECGAYFRDRVRK
jgi:Ca2+-binding EF-hand superfamily protein